MGEEREATNVSINRYTWGRGERRLTLQSSALDSLGWKGGHVEGWWCSLYGTGRRDCAFFLFLQDNGPVRESLRGGGGASPLHPWFRAGVAPQLIWLQLLTGSVAWGKVSGPQAPQLQSGDSSSSFPKLWLWELDEESIEVMGPD